MPRTSSFTPSRVRAVESTMVRAATPCGGPCIARALKPVMHLITKHHSTYLQAEHALLCKLL
jgi:hypothetical protein